MATFVPKTSGEQFAVWLAKNQPDLFLRVLKASQGGKLAGLTDVLSSIGTGIANAAKAVGSFVVSPEGASSLAALGSVYLTTKAQQSALSTQVKLAQLGQSPAPISFPSPTSQPVMYSTVAYDPVTGIPTASGTMVPAPSPYTPSAGQQFLTQATVGNLKTFAPWLLAAGLFAFLLFRGGGGDRTRRTNPRRKSSGGLTAKRVRLDRGGYDSKGRYFGVGAPLWLVDDGWGNVYKHVRAESRAEALGKVNS